MQKNEKNISVVFLLKGQIYQYFSKLGFQDKKRMRLHNENILYR